MGVVYHLLQVSLTGNHLRISQQYSSCGIPTRLVLIIHCVLIYLITGFEEDQISGMTSVQGMFV